MQCLYVYLVFEDRHEYRLEFQAVIDYGIKSARLACKVPISHLVQSNASDESQDYGASAST